MHSLHSFDLHRITNMSICFRKKKIKIKYYTFFLWLLTRKCLLGNICSTWHNLRDLKHVCFISDIMCDTYTNNTNHGASQMYFKNMWAMHVGSYRWSLGWWRGWSNWQRYWHSRGQAKGVMGNSLCLYTCIYVNHLISWACIIDDCGEWGMSHGVCHMIGAAQLELLLEPARRQRSINVKALHIRCTYIYNLQCKI